MISLARGAGLVFAHVASPSNFCLTRKLLWSELAGPNKPCKAGIFKSTYVARGFVPLAVG